jgi:hypothetical protein
MLLPLVVWLIMQLAARAALRALIQMVNTYVNIFQFFKKFKENTGLGLVDI